jgi:hypothetical protein
LKIRPAIALAALGNVSGNRKRSPLDLVAQWPALAVVEEAKDFNRLTARPLPDFEFLE